MEFDEGPVARAGLTPRRLGLLAGAGALLFASAGAQLAMPGLGRGGADAPGRRLGERLAEQLELAQGEIDLLRIRTQRLDSVFRYSTRYRVPADLAALIYDVALWEGLDPDLGFRLVKAESNFEHRAVSSAGAIGLAQVMPSTARALSPGIATDRLFDRHTNLHLGFRLLRDLIARYDGDLRLALVDYNGGPRKVREFIKDGDAGVLGYVRSVLRRH